MLLSRLRRVHELAQTTRLVRRAALLLSELSDVPTASAETPTVRVPKRLRVALATYLLQRARDRCERISVRAGRHELVLPRARAFAVDAFLHRHSRLTLEIPSTLRSTSRVTVQMV
jgi:hypothetical protein